MRLLICIIFVTIVFSSAVGLTNRTFSKCIFKAQRSIDTSIYVLDPEVACGSNSKVRLSAGIAASYEWYRNYERIPAANQKNHTAVVSGMYKVIVSDGFGNKDSSRPVNIYIVPQPVALFSLDKVIQCRPGNEFKPVNQSSIQSGSLAYTWFFGDGQFALEKNATHGYSSVGNYKIRLVAVSDFGCSDTSTADVSVVAPPKVDFSVNAISQCINNNVFTFSNNSSMEDFPLEFRWDFGDGSNSYAKNPSHSYANSTSYKVKLVAYNNKACADSMHRQIVVHPKPVTLYSVNNNQQCENGNYFQFTNISTIASGKSFPVWYFGDGILSSEISPNYSYTTSGLYKVKLIQTSDQGCKDSTSYDMQVNPSPIAKFDVNIPTQCFQGHKFIFSNKSTVNNSQLSFQWNFGDGLGQSTLVDPQYSYESFGSFQVTLRANTTQNCLSTISKIITINPTPSGEISDPASDVICDGSFVTLQAKKNESYQWYLDKNSIPNATSQTLNATMPGVYSLHVKNEYGCIFNSPKTIQLTKVFQPVVNFSFDKTCVNFSTDFKNLSDLSRAGVVDYLWYFGDTASSILPSPSHTYKTQGTFSSRLTVTPRFCKSLAVTKVMQLTTQLSDIPLKYPSVNAIASKDTELKARAFSGASYLWSPGRALSANNTQKTIFNGTSSQIYQVKIVTANGCEFTDTLDVRIFSSQEIFVPELFSPNNDGKNDKLNFFPVGVVNLKYFKIFNRWGKLMFQSRNEFDGWDGTYLGIGQPVGSYLWHAEGLDIDGKVIRRTGKTILIR